MPAVLSTQIYGPGLLAVTTSGSSSPLSPTPTVSPQASGGSLNRIQLHTIFEIVVGFVGFVILIFAGSFVSRFPYFTQSKVDSTNPPRSPSRRRLWTYANIRRALLNDNQTMDGSRSRLRPPIQHVEPMIATIPMSTGHWSQAFDYTASCPPPYEPSPPPYSEPLRYPPQHPRVPPIAVAEV